MGKFNNIVGYGFNQKGACNRDGSLKSFDYNFSTYEKAKKEEEDIVKCGYGNTIYGIVEVTVLDEIKAILNHLNEEESMSLKKFRDILKDYDIIIDDLSENNLIEGIMFYFKFNEYNEIIDYQIREDI